MKRLLGIFAGSDFDVESLLNLLSLESGTAPHSNIVFFRPGESGKEQEQLGRIAVTSILVRLYVGAARISEKLRGVVNAGQKPFQALGVMTVIWFSAGFVFGLLALVVKYL